MTIFWDSPYGWDLIFHEAFVEHCHHPPMGFGTIFYYYIPWMYLLLLWIVQDVLMCRFTTSVCHIGARDDFFSSAILSISLFPDSMVLRQKGCLHICSCMIYIDILIGNIFCSTSNSYASSRC